MKKRTVALLLALVLVIGMAAGGTVAWLVDSTGKVTNTFTIGDVEISLYEHKLLENGTLGTETVTQNEYSFVPGDTLPKDPYVVVDPASVDCYVFVKITEKNNLVDGVEVFGGYTVADGWTHYDTLDDGSEVYYRVVDDSGERDEPLYILAGKCAGHGEGESCDCATRNGYVTINTAVTKGMAATINDAKTQPELQFVAAAVQVANIVAEGYKSAVDVAFEQISGF